MSVCTLAETRWQRLWHTWMNSRKARERHVSDAPLLRSYGTLLSPLLLQLVEPSWEICIARVLIFLVDFAASTMGSIINESHGKGMKG